jgi:putative transposase
MKKHHTEEQILRILKEAEQGKPLPDVLRKHGIASGSGNWSGRT